MSLLDTASLIVTPNGYKEGKLYSVIPSDGSGDLSVTRATTATRVNSAGLVELVPYNLLQYSEQFNNGYWGTYQATIAANNITAPDGTLTADRMTQSGAGGATVYVLPFNYTNSVYTASCYFKAGTANEVLIELNVTGGNCTIYYNLSTQVISGFGTYTSANIESVGNGWYRCSVVSALVNGSGYIALGKIGNVGETIYLWGAQMVEGTEVKPYQKTETRLNIPRLDYSNGTCPSLLVEPQRTNLALYSSSFDNGAWTPQTISVSANATTSPDGTTTAETLTPSGSGAYDNRVYQTHSVTSGAVYTLSVWAKSSASNAKLTLGLQNHGGQVFSITNEWERYSVAVTALSTGGNFNIYAGDVTPTTGVVNSSNIVTIWGAQLELGSYPTSYIPTTSASVTRNADVISKTGISSLIGQTEGTMFVDAYITGKDSSNGSILFATDKVSSGALIRIIYTSTNALRFDVFDGSSFQCLISAGAYNVGDRVKVAGGYKNNDFVMYVNGTQIGTDTSGSVPATDTANINTSIYGDTNGSFVNAAALWTTRLTNTQLAQLTTI